MALLSDALRIRQTGHGAMRCPIRNRDKLSCLWSARWIEAQLAGAFDLAVRSLRGCAHPSNNRTAPWRRACYPHRPLLRNLKAGDAALQAAAVDQCQSHDRGSVVYRAGVQDDGGSGHAIGRVLNLEHDISSRA